MCKLGWIVTWDMNDKDLHVRPEGEEHCIDGVECLCGPEVDIEGEHLIILHKAFDYREIFEQIDDILKR